MNVTQIAVGLGLVLLVTIAALWRPVLLHLRERRFRLARKQFHIQRERLEARFFTLASQSGRPRGLQWVECDFENAVSYALDRRTHMVTAFVGVTIRFSAIEGGPMEGVEAVGNLRAATAVFQFKGQGWTTVGRAVFNLNPAEAIAYYRDDFELLAQDTLG